MSISPRPLTAIAVLGLSCVLSACSADQPTPSAATEGGEERTLTVYSGRDEELVGPLLEQFESASGIDVEVRYAGSAELAAQLMEEADRSPAQVFLAQDSGSLGAVASAGLLEALPDSITSRVPDEFTSQDGSWVGLTGRTRVIAYDSEEYEQDEVPSDVFELTEPAWNGKVGIAPSNASFQSFVTAMRVTEGEERAQEWLEGLVANDVQVYEGNGAMLEAVNSGALDLALINHYYWARSEQDPQTLRAQLRFGEPGTVSALVNVTGAGILAGQTGTEASEFVEYLVSEPAQRYFLETTHEYPLIDGLAGPEGVPPLDELGGPDIDLSELSSVQETADLIVAAGLL